MHNIAPSGGGPLPATGTGNDADDVSAEKMEMLETVGGEMATRVQSYFPDTFRVAHRVEDAKQDRLALRVRIPQASDLLINVNANEMELTELASDRGDEEGETVESVSAEIAASIVTQMKASVDPRAMKSRPAS